MGADSIPEFEREWTEMLNEIRVALPGVQLLFAFLLTVPFSDRFVRMAGWAHDVFFGAFLCTAAASAFLTAPSVYHRLHWRRDVRDKEEMLRTCNRLAITGVVLLAVAMSAAVFVLATLIFDATLAWAATAVTAASFFTLWFGLPLSRRKRDERK